MPHLMQRRIFYRRGGMRAALTPAMLVIIRGGYRHGSAYHYKVNCWRKKRALFGFAAPLHSFSARTHSCFVVAHRLTISYV